jgi:hypothetical protein
MASSAANLGLTMDEARAWLFKRGDAALAEDILPLIAAIYEARAKFRS